MRRPIRVIFSRHPLLTYFALAFLVSWAAVYWLIAPTGIPGTGAEFLNRVPLVFFVMLLGPSLAGLGLTALCGGRSGMRNLWARQRRWRLGRWWAAPLITPALAALLGILAVWSPDLTPGLLTATDTGSLIVLALAIGLLAGCLEDVGWTGFALPRLQARWGWARAGLVLGVLWGLWHLLADYWGNADAWGPLYLARYLLWCGAAFTAYRMLIAWALRHTDSLLLAQLMHAGFTGGQVLLMPALTPSGSALLWYAAFAGGLWLLVGSVMLLETAQRHALQTDELHRVRVTIALKTNALPRGVDAVAGAAKHDAHTWVTGAFDDDTRGRQRA
jgi:membrane protease YdiL (CAAX protease family)